MKPWAWSFSRLKSWEVCPKRFFHYDVIKDIKDDHAPNEGLDAHKAYEARIKDGKKLPLHLTHHEPILARLEALPGEHYAEQKLALTKDFKPTGFFSRDVWFRTVLDFCAIFNTAAAVVDYKTGKIQSDLTQLKLMSATIMHYAPEVERVQARLLFLNHAHAERADFGREDIPGIWAEILPRVRQLEKGQADQEYPPKPSGLCVRHCSVTSCPFYGRGSR
jgi:hypothetical protein